MDEECQLFESDPSFWATTMNDGDFFVPIEQWDQTSPLSGILSSDMSSPDRSSQTSYPSSPSSFAIQLDGIPAFNTGIDPTVFTPQPDTSYQTIDVDADSDDVVEKRPKKRGRKPSQKDFGDADVTNVLLTDKELLEFTSQEYEDKLKLVSQGNGLTPAEQKKAQDIRRKIKNRESARNSRQKKKVLLDTLDVQVRQLQLEKENLASQLSHYQKLSKSLAEQVTQLQEENMKLKGNSVTELRSLVNKTSVSSAKKAGTALLVILFSFGLLFNINNSPLNPSTINQITKILPTILSDTNNLQNSFQPTHGPVRGIMQMDMDSSLVTTQPITQPEVRENGFTLADPVRIPERLKRSGQAARIEADVEQKNQIRISDQEESGEIQVGTENGSENFEMGEFSNESATYNHTANLIADDRTDDYNRYFDDDTVKSRPNTAYFACSNLIQMTPPKSEPFDQDSDYYISFIVPSSGLPNQQVPLISNEDTDNAIVEIHCRVMDVHISPAGKLSAPVQVSS